MNYKLISRLFPARFEFLEGIEVIQKKSGVTESGLLKYSDYTEEETADRLVKPSRSNA